ncbi:LacI family DNA-binding transcriptional regulator [Micromonospora craniellae]|uniref:LacI family transcriptional regulator n=1 Tax=Micromonospora craniellae TaxID=2294034 RepID=A0A372FUV3_9ACTN|nr:LacI family DNA-binding transcriptional regulator [Micromonospora craniellae]QOC92428.1 LacI family DNA-binding transcriptional regulator [Micromonospora craniellae]RFS44577.1 LacI family transcriptional regulator [Micromonospora craniellae]
MVTIGDVARAAGVSRSTASYALSGKRTISAEVRERVNDAVRRLGYTPNAGARALATSQTMVIGLLAQFLEGEFAPAMLQYILGVCDASRELGYDTLLITEADGAHALSRITRSRMVDGIVLLNVAHQDPRLPVLRAAPQPGALVGLPEDCSGVDVFDLDFEKTGRSMVDHLHRLGHREIILISQPELVVQRGGAWVWRLRSAALDQARRRGIVLHAVFGESRQPAVGRSLHAALDAYPDATGLLVDNEAAAAALPMVLHARGIEVPRDMSVVGRYSDEFAQLFSLPYSSVDSAPDRLGRLAVRQLVRRIGAEAETNEPYVLRLVAPEFHDRESSAPPPA